jgi:RNA polymerase sigma-70 factor (sigma-E family)
MSDTEFTAFVAARYEALARTAFLFTGDRGHAEDLAQSALIKTLRSWDRLADPAAAETYTRTVMVRLAGRWSRRRWRGEVAVELTDLPDSADDRAAALDVRAALQALPWPQRAVLVLRYFDDLSERETAAVLGCSEGTVKSRAHRAIAALRASALLDPTGSTP